jgi:hypothetical protein
MDEIRSITWDDSEEYAEYMMEQWYTPEEIIDASDLQDEDLVEKYLENWYSIRDTADELWLDEEQLLEEHYNDYDYE